MKVRDLITSLREGSGNKLTPEERMEVMQKLLNSENQTEEVVLNEQKLNAHLSSSTSGLFKDDSAETQIPEATANPAQRPGSAASGRFGKLLQLFRGSKSASIHASVDNSDAPGTSLSNRKSLAENKTIVYVVAGGVVVFLGWQGVNFFLDSGHQQFDNKSAVAKAKTGKSRAAVRKTRSKPAVAKTTTKNDSRNVTRFLSNTSIQAALQDCTVAATTRTALTESPENTKKYDPADYTLAVLAIQSFQRKYRASDVNTRIETSNTKNSMARRLLSPEIRNLRIQINQYREARIIMQRELNGLRKQERESQDGRRLQNRVVAGVNQGIRLRNEIEQIEAHLRDAPSEDDLILVEEQISILNSIIGSENSNATDPANKTVNTMQEVTSLISLDPAQLQQKLSQMIKSDLGPITAAVAKNSPDLKGYQIQNATKTLSQFVGMFAVLRSMPNNILAGLDKEQFRINNKLNDLLGTSNAHWLDYAPCLKGDITVSESG